jgi:hypothetical protein
MMSMNHELLEKKMRSLGMLSVCDEITHHKHVKYPPDTIMDGGNSIEMAPMADCSLRSDHKMWDIGP